MSTPTLGSRYRRTPRRVALRAAVRSDYRNANLDADIWCTVMRVGLSGEVMAR